MKNFFLTILPVKKNKLPVTVMLLFALGAITFMLSAFSCKHSIVVADTPPDLPLLNIKIEQVAEGLQAPLAIAFPGNGDMLVAEQTGTIRMVKNGKPNGRPFLDIHNKLVHLTPDYDERGLLGFVLHPNFKTNRKFYVYYSAPSAHGENNEGVLAEYKASATDPNVADPNSERILLIAEHPEFNHDGGCLQFGPDGYLYLSIGDGGGGGDKHGPTGNGQNLGVLMGKILRININSGKTYSIPKDNPFVNKPGVRPEIWSYGMRNTWRFSFDKASGRLFAGDVGQDTYEEVDIIEKGGNYGWHITEGLHCYDPATGCSFNGIIKPIAEYSHHEGISVTGGYVYNGTQMNGFKGKYIFADWSGPMFYLQGSGNSWKRGKLKITNAHPDLKITSFGEDPSGELYMTTNTDTGPGGVKGAVYKIVRD